MRTLMVVDFCAWCGARKGRCTCAVDLSGAFDWRKDPEEAVVPYDPVEELITSLTERRAYPEDWEGPFGD